jgi:hypothetical protein
MPKPFRELTNDEATQLARDCKRGARTNEEIKRRLTEAGFNGEAAAVTSIPCGDGTIEAMLLVWGPQGEVINV